MIVSKKTLWERAARAMKKERYEEHLQNTVVIAKRDPEFAVQQVEVLIHYVLAEVIDNFDPPSKA